MPLSKPALLLTAIFSSPAASAGESSFVLPHNLAKAEVLQRAARELVPGKAPRYTEFNRFSFRKTRFSTGPNPFPQGLAFDVIADIDELYRCSAQVILTETGTLLSFLPSGKTLCHLMSADEVGAK